MIMNQILNLVSQNQEKFIILDKDSQPQAVILSFAEYQKLRAKSALTKTKNLDNIMLNNPTDFSEPQEDDFFIDELQSSNKNPQSKLPCIEEENRFYLEEID